MQTRKLGRAGIEVSVLGFGCGAVGGLMVRGSPADQERAVARALDFGVTYFDTAAMYGNGESERNLGRVLKSLKPELTLGTKVRVAAAERRQIGAAVAASLEASLRRLQREQVDLFQLHNHITLDGGEADLSPQVVLGEVVPAFERLREQGKTRFCGITAVGDTAALHQVVDAKAFDTAQVSYNLLNPSAGATVAAGFPAHDFGNLLARAQAASMGVIAIRVLAAGALSGVDSRHPLGSPSVEPIGSGRDYRVDIERARRLEPLVREGFADSLVEAAIRFVIANDAVSTALVGYSTIEQLEYAVAAVEKGPLPTAALERLKTLHNSFVGETR
ncbi:MAG TPA: aldo/keto reductase [Stellaceae bacterium]|jgi:L-galactose dehydrogenase/L-glyceraldehyde 3-phosphate reductase